MKQQDDHISLQNYESRFLLFADGELSAEQHQALLRFLDENPALKPELDALLATVSHADSKLVFQKKNSLLKKTPDTEFTDEQLLLYTDGELDAATAEEIQASGIPALKQRLALLKKAYITPDPSIVYQKKQQLYKRSRLTVLRLWLPRVAAAVLLGAAGMAVFFQTQPGRQDAVAGAFTGIGTTPPKFPALIANPLENPVAITKQTETHIPAKKTKNHEPPKPTGSNKNSEKEKENAHTPTPKPLSETMPFDIAKTDATSNKIPVQTPEWPPLPKKTDVAAEPALADNLEKPRKGFLKNMAERLKDKAFDILSDDDENITVAGFAINLKK